jgi:uncharacterized protein (TIGR01777 family)
MHYGICTVSRHPPETNSLFNHVMWDMQTLGDWVHELEGASAVVNLVGRTVDCIKTPDHCDEILRSRVQSTQLIGQALREIQTPPPVWVQMSTAHIYGDPPETVCTENSPYGYGLAPFVAIAWEKAFEEASLPSMRKVILRTSFVLGKHGGALQRLSWLTRMGLGGTVGHGKQGISWIHEDDMNRIMIRALDEVSMQGVYIASAPNPVSNAEFMRNLRKAIGIPIGLPAYSWMVKTGAPLVMKTDPDLALYGRYCIPQKLMDEGFEFQYPSLYEALYSIYK